MLDIKLGTDWTDYIQNLEDSTSEYYTIAGVDFVPFIILSGVLFHSDYRGYQNSNYLIKQLFKFPRTQFSSEIPSTSSRLLRAFNNEVTVYNTLTNGLRYYLSKGILLDSNNKILFCLTLKKEAVVNAYECSSYSTVDENSSYFVGYDKFVMFVSTELHHNPEYATFYRRLKKIYLDFCFTKGIEMRIISSSKIKENTFANNFKVDFKSINQLQTHLNEDLPFLLTLSDEQFMEGTDCLMLEAPPPLVEQVSMLQINKYYQGNYEEVTEQDEIEFNTPAEISAYEDEEDDDDYDEDYEQEEVVDIEIEEEVSDAYTMDQFYDTLALEQVGVYPDRFGASPNDELVSHDIRVHQQVSSTTLEDIIRIFNQEELTVEDMGLVDEDSVDLLSVAEEELEQYIEAPYGDEDEETERDDFPF